MRVLLLGLLFVGGAVSAAPDYNEPSFAAFMDVASKFERKLYGCPDEAWKREQCSPARAIFDARLQMEVWKRGGRLFGGAR
jgi:hypothetical protein